LKNEKKTSFKEMGKDRCSEIEEKMPLAEEDPPSLMVIKKSEGITIDRDQKSYPGASWT